MREKSILQKKSKPAQKAIKQEGHGRKKRSRPSARFIPSIAEEKNVPPLYPNSASFASIDPQKSTYGKKRRK